MLLLNQQNKVQLEPKVRAISCYKLLSLTLFIPHLNGYLTKITKAKQMNTNLISPLTFLLTLSVFLVVHACTCTLQEKEVNKMNYMYT